MNTKFKLWFNSIIFSVFIFIVAIFYHLVSNNTSNINLLLINRALGDSAIVIVSISLAFSGLAYFWNFVDKQIIYRKHLGLVGFNLALLHGTISLFFLPNNFEFLNYYLAPGNRLPFILALISLLILMTMTLASNNPSIKSMGAKKWKILMRFGFVALLFALTHFTLKKYSSWFEWNFSDHNYLPPLSLIVFVLGLFSLLLRISLYFNKINKEKKH